LILQDILFGELQQLPWHLTVHRKLHGLQQLQSSGPAATSERIFESGNGHHKLSKLDGKAIHGEWNHGTN